jgi:integrase
LHGPTQLGAHVVRVAPPIIQNHIVQGKLPTDWLFHTTHGRPGFLNPNDYRNRILQTAAIRANVEVIDSGKRDEKGTVIVKTDVNFPSLRRTCATLFGDRGEDSKSTQAQLRHADTSFTFGTTRRASHRA